MEAWGGRASKAAPWAPGASVVGRRGTVVEVAAGACHSAWAPAGGLQTADSGNSEPRKERQGWTVRYCSRHHHLQMSCPPSR